MGSRTVGRYKVVLMGCPVEERGVGKNQWSLFSLEAVSETSSAWTQCPEK